MDELVVFVDTNIFFGIKVFAMSRKVKTILWIVIIVIIFIAVYFFSQKRPRNEQVNVKMDQSKPVQVGVATQQDVPIQVSALGTVISDRVVTVTSRVTGNLEKIYFNEGQYVKQGELLAQIDVRPYQATLEQYQGTLAESQAQMKNAELTLERYKRLYAKDSIAKQDLDTQLALTNQYVGAVKAAQGQIKTAQLNITYSKVTAPISGYIGLRKTDIGNAVSADSTGIVTITQMHPIAVTFGVPQNQLANIVEPIRAGKALPVQAFDQSGTNQVAQGEVKIISNEIDATTGTVMLKAIFNNQDNKLFPNQFVNIKLNTSTLPQAIVVPTAAVQASDSGKFVFTIDQQSTAHKVVVKTGPETADGKVVVTGIRVGDRVVTSGSDALGNGSKVKIVTPEVVDTSILDAAKKPEHSRRPH